MATIRTNKDGSKSYQVRYPDPNNPGRQKSQTFRTEIRAKKAEAALTTDRERGTSNDPKLGRESLNSYWTRWYDRAKEIGHPAPSTLSKYECVFRLHVSPILGSKPVGKITRGDIIDLVAATEAKVSAYQAVETLKLTRMLLNRVVDDEIRPTNPAARVKAPETERTPIRILTPQEIVDVVEALPERWRAFVLLDAYSSLRWSELVALKRDDVDLEARTLRVDEALVEVRGKFVWGRPKTKKSGRTVDLPEVIIRPIAEHMLRYPPLLNTDDPNREGLLFYGEGRGPVRRHVFRPLWQNACAEAGVEGSRPGWMRHTGASLGYHVTKDMKAVAGMLGHSSTRMMDTVYVEIYPEASRAIADGIDEMVRAATSRK